MPIVHRIHNFSAGPAVLPTAVLEQIQRDLLALPGVGMSILEISHRSKAFESIIAETEADIRALADVPSGYRVLFLQGGASLQFSMVPMNFLSGTGSADYVVTGTWSAKAAAAARHCGKVNEHREQHRQAVHPHLVSTKCDHCHKLNWLGNLSGKIVDVDVQNAFPNG